jgi:hypothetical protein
LWDAVQNNKTGTGLNIEVWSAARRDVELKRRAAGLHRDARGVIRDALGPAAQKGGSSRAEALATLSLAVLNGLSVTEYLEGDDAKVKEAYEAFLGLLRQGLEAPSNVS